VFNENSNMMISKLRGVYRIQSCDPLRGLEIIWEMSNTVILKLQVFAIPSRANLRTV
jgi:hypothetical protein